jgi:hypothetical protein
MKNNLVRLLLSLAGAAVLTTVAFAQGTINFVNGGGPLVNWNPTDWSQTGPNVVPIPPPAGSFYFALLTAPIGTTDPLQFTFSGVYATNLNVPGIIRGGSVVPSWATGTSRSFEVAGWDFGTGGATFNPFWLTDPASRPDYWGVSVVGAGFAGGTDPVSGGPIPPLNIFGGNGITQSWVLMWIPEPATAAVAGLGAAALLIFRRRR